MLLAPTKRMDIEDAIGLVEHDSAFVDLRPIDDYLDVHVPGSLALLYEEGPGMASRVRDCIPLEVSLVLLGTPGIDLDQAAAALRGKGFVIHGIVENGVTAWGELKGVPASTEIALGPTPPEGWVLDVGDPAAADVPGAFSIPIERLWERVDEVPLERPVVVVAGYGVRAALAVGILERKGATNVYFWRARRRGGA